MPRIAILFTGGTISMTVDPVAGGRVPSLDGAAILARTPGLGAIAEIVAVDRPPVPASHLSFETVLDIGRQARALGAQPDIDGVVVVQGTDTIEETSFAWDLVHDLPSAMVVTGAMRVPAEADFDGPANLRDAVAAAASLGLREAGVVVVLGGTIEPADDVTKTHTSALDTFRSPDVGSLGVVRDGEVRLARPRGPRRHLVTSRSARVETITAGLSSDGRLVDAAVGDGVAGLVIAATGAGNTSPALLAAAQRAMTGGIPVVLASRCLAGSVSDAYAFPGGGATWLRAGAIPAGHLCAIKARVALALGLGAGLDHAQLIELLADPVP